MLIAQDTLHINFEFGSNRINKSQKLKLDSLPINFDVFQLDSVVYIGMADTVGNIDANLKLSYKRAVAVNSYFKNRFHFLTDSY